MDQILSVIKKRRSIVSFSDQEIGKDILERVFEAARWAPSSYNEQPWTFLVANKYEDPDMHQLMVSVLMEKNRVWAQNAPVLILPLAAKMLALNDKPNRFSFYDTGQAVAFLSLQATAEDLFLHQMGGFNSEECRSLFKIPGHLEPTAVIALGYKGNRPELAEEIKLKEKKEQVRKSLNEIFVKTLRDE